jgi:hypothetical protein
MIGFRLNRTRKCIELEINQYAEWVNEKNWTPFFWYFWK